MQVDWNVRRGLDLDSARAAAYKWTYGADLEAMPAVYNYVAALRDESLPLVPSIADKARHVCIQGCMCRRVDYSQFLVRVFSYVTCHNMNTCSQSNAHVNSVGRSSWVSAMGRSRQWHWQGLLELPGSGLPVGWPQRLGSALREQRHVSVSV